MGAEPNGEHQVAVYAHVLRSSTQNPSSKHNFHWFIKRHLTGRAHSFSHIHCDILRGASAATISVSCVNNNFLSLLCIFCPDIVACRGLFYIVVFRGFIYGIHTSNLLFIISSSFFFKTKQSVILVFLPSDKKREGFMKSVFSIQLLFCLS